MFGRSKPVIFDPYGTRRSRSAVPRWLVVLLTGIVIGAGGLVLVQERYLPPRLSADASAELRRSFDRAEAERLRLKNELAETAQRLEAALTERKGLVDELAASRETVEHLREDLAAVVASLPPDPRGGAVQVRAARFTPDAGMLAYDVVLSRDRAGAKPLTGVMQFVVVAEPARGAKSSVALPPVAISVGSYESLRGSLPLPEGSKPRQVRINVLDRLDGKLLGMRLVNMK